MCSSWVAEEVSMMAWAGEGEIAGDSVSVSLMDVRYVPARWLVAGRRGIAVESRAIRAALK